MARDPLQPLLDINEGERLVVDIEQEYGDNDRGVATLTTDAAESRGVVPVASEQTGTRVGVLARDADDGNQLGVFEPKRGGAFGQQTATVRDVTTTDRDDLDPLSIGRDTRSGEFTPDDIMPAPASPAARDPDDGEFADPNPEPITDIGRERRSGLFDLF